MEWGSNDLLEFFRKHTTRAPLRGRGNDRFEQAELLDTAVLFLVFNRPEPTALVFEAIRRAKPPRLYIAADGPRRRRGDAEKVARVREIATRVDWTCEVKTLLRDKNLGCKNAVGSAITWFFEHEEQGIILEDDVLPSSGFFAFCEAGLEKWKNQPNIGGLGGFVPVENGAPFMSLHGSVWGWATWKRVWRQYRSETLSLTKNDLIFLATHASIFSMAEKMNICHAQKKRPSDTWDYYWLFSRIRNRLFMILPGAPLTDNIGFAEYGGVHHIGRKPKSLGRMHGAVARPDAVDDRLVSFDPRKIIITDYKRFWSRNGISSLSVLTKALTRKPVLVLHMIGLHLMVFVRQRGKRAGEP